MSELAAHNKRGFGKETIEDRDVLQNAHFSSQLQALKTGDYLHKATLEGKDRRELILLLRENVQQKLAPELAKIVGRLKIEIYQNTEKVKETNGELSSTDQEIADILKELPYATKEAAQEMRQRILVLSHQEGTLDNPQATQEPEAENKNTKSTATERINPDLAERVTSTREALKNSLAPQKEGRVHFISNYTGYAITDTYGQTAQQILSRVQSEQPFYADYKNDTKLSALKKDLQEGGAEILVFTGHGSSRGSWHLAYDRDAKANQDLENIEVQSFFRWPYAIQSEGLALPKSFLQVRNDTGEMQHLTDTQMVLLNAEHNARTVVFYTCFSARMAGRILMYNKHIDYAIGVDGAMLISFADDFNATFMTSLQLCGSENIELAFHLSLFTLDETYSQRYKNDQKTYDIMRKQIGQMRLARRIDAPPAPFLAQIAQTLSP